MGYESIYLFDLFGPKLPRPCVFFGHEDKTLCATVDPSELLGSPGSSLLWSITWTKVL